MKITDSFVPSQWALHRVRHLAVTPVAELPTLVLLHDALGSILQWKKFPELLAQSCGLNAVIIERQGHGKSSPLLAKRAKNYLHHEAQVVLPELLSILGLRQPVLVGHSDGGSIALLYAARFEVTALITIAAHTFVEEITLSGIKEALQIQDKLLPKLRHYHGEKTEALFNAWWQTWLDEDFEDWNITKEVSKVACPTLAIQGEHDEYGTEAQARSIAGNVRGGGQIAMIEGGGHMPHLQFPEKVVGLIRRFLEL